MATECGLNAVKEEEQSDGVPALGKVCGYCT